MPVFLRTDTGSCFRIPAQWKQIIMDQGYPPDSAGSWWSGWAPTKWEEVYFSLFLWNTCINKFKRAIQQWSSKRGGEARLTAIPPAPSRFGDLKESRDVQLCLDCQTAKNEGKIMANTDWVFIKGADTSVLRNLHVLTPWHLLVLL